MRVLLTVLAACGSLCAGARLQAQQAYLDRLAAAPGDTVRVFVSSAQEYRVGVLRSSYFNSNVELLRSAWIPAGLQTAFTGSFAQVQSSPALAVTGPLTLEAWIRPGLSGRGKEYGVLSKYGGPSGAGYMLHLLPNGHLSFYLGRSATYSPGDELLSSSALPERQWTHVVATWDGATKRIYIDGQLDTASAWTGPILDAPEPVRVGARGESGRVAYTFDGQIDSPALYDRALTAAEAAQRFAERADYGPTNPGILPGAVAQWNFGEGEGSVLADATGNGHDLTLVNGATRGVPGPSPRTGPQGSQSIRFASDDGVNPAWTSAFTFAVPPAWESGFYLVEVAPRSGVRLRLPLVVTPAPGQRPRIAVLAATNTWHAYNGWSNSLYDTHPDGTIAYYVGMLQPNPGGLADLQSPGSGYSHLVDAERYLYRWLDEHGYPFDLYTDLDLHRDPSLLAPYSVLILNGHSEYWSNEMVDQVEAFLDGGGSLVNLSGNTMWSLVTYDATLSVMEGRKHPHSAGTIPAAERWHSQASGVLGGTLRCIGRPEPAVLGTGYGLLFSGAFGAYAVQQPGHWVFQGTGAAAGTRIGLTSLNGSAMLGHEADVVHPVWSPSNLQVLARGVDLTSATELDISNCQTRSTAPRTVGADMIYFDHTGGGGVFGAPSIAFGGSVMVDALATQVLRNVLDRFLDQRRAACAFRNGSGINPMGFDCVTNPVLGTTWQSTIATTAATLSTALGLSASGGVQPLLGGELLIGAVPAPLVQLGVGQHAVGIPDLSSLLGAGAFGQGFRADLVAGAGTPTLVLLNGQDLRLGR